MLGTAIVDAAPELGELFGNEFGEVTTSGAAFFGVEWVPKRQLCINSLVGTTIAIYLEIGMAFENCAVTAP